MTLVYHRPPRFKRWHRILIDPVDRALERPVTWHDIGRTAMLGLFGAALISLAAICLLW